MATDDYTSLLGRSNQSWGELAGTLLAQQKGKNKKAKSKQRKALVAGLLLSAWDNKKVNNVIRNLKEADVDKQYDIAATTHKWDNYKEFITSDKQFIMAGGAPKKEGEVNSYFKSLGAQSFYNSNPNFEEQYKDRINRNAERTEQIDKIAQALQDDHMKKRDDLISMGSITAGTSPAYKTQEQFLKPYEDYYRTKKQRASDPSELSAVHSLFGLVGPAKKRRQALDAKLENYEEMQKSYSKYDTLLDIPSYAVAKTYYNPDDIGYTESDILRLVETTVENDSLQNLIVSKARRMIKTNGVVTTYNTAQNEKTISDSQLQALLLTTAVDFEKATVQAEQYKVEFGDLYKVRRKVTELPFTVEETYDTEGKVISRKRTVTDKDSYALYVAEEDIYVSQKLGLFDQDTVDLQNALLGKKYEEEINVTINKDTGEKTPNEPELISMYNKVILDSSTSSATIMAARDWTEKQMETGWLAKFRDYLKDVRKIPAPEVDAMNLNDLNTYYIAVSLEGFASKQNILKAQEKLKNPTN